MTWTVLVLVALVPGALAAFVVPRGPERWVALAAAPAVSAGLLSVALSWLPLLPVPDDVQAMLVLQALLALAIGALGIRPVALRRRRAAGPSEPSATGSRTPWVRRLWTPVLVALAVAVPVAYGCYLLRDLLTVPGWDAANHGYMVGEMLSTGHATVAAACTTGSVHPVMACPFYPIAADVLWGQAAALSGGLVSSAMTGSAAVLSPLALALGTFALARWTGARPVVSAAAAVAVCFIGPLWPVLYLGRVNEQMATCFSPATALLLAATLRGRHRAPMGLLAGVASAGIVMTHSYQAIFVAVLALAVALWRREPRGTPVTGRWAGPLIAVAALGVGIGPYLPEIAAVPAAVGHYPAAFPGQWMTAIRFYLVDLARYAPLGSPSPSTVVAYDAPQVIYRCALGIGGGVVLGALTCWTRPMRWARPWVLAWAVLTALGIWTSASVFAADHIGSLWYGTLERYRVMLIPVYGVVAVAGWSAAGLAVAWLVRQVARRSDRERLGAALSGMAVLVAAGAVVVASSMPAGIDPVRGMFVKRSPQSPAFPVVMHWLADHSRPGQSVAFDHNIDLLSWAHGDYRVPSLYGLSPHIEPGASDWTTRYHVLQWLAGTPGVAPAGCATRRFNVRYLTSGPPILKSSIFAASFNHAKLGASPNVRLVFSAGPYQVYEVTKAALACPNP